MQVATLIALVVYVWKTWEMAAATRRAAEASTSTVEEMKLARREASAPRLAIYFASPSTSISEIVIENFGDTTATNVRFEFTPPLASSDKDDRGVQFFETPKTLPPHSRLRHAFDLWPEYFEANLPKRYDVKVRFQRLGEAEVQRRTSWMRVPLNTTRPGTYSACTNSLAVSSSLPRGSSAFSRRCSQLREAQRRDET